MSTKKSQSYLSKLVSFVVVSTLLITFFPVVIGFGLVFGVLLGSVRMVGKK